MRHKMEQEGEDEGEDPIQSSPAIFVTVLNWNKRMI